MADILVVDDDQSVAKAFEHFLAFDGHACRIASNAEDAIRFVDERRPHLVMMDVRMPGIDGLEALQQMRARFPGIYIVIMTAYGTSQTSIDAIRAGAFDYLTKPLDLDNLREVISKALAAQQISESVGASSVESTLEESPISLVGATPAMLDVYKLIGRLATNSVAALIVGERGTGKRLAVATIHDNSSRRDQPMTSVDGGEASEAEVDERLFGRLAGTVELRHVDRLTASRQGRVLHALVARRTRGSGPRLTVRIVATTERDLADDARAGQFSQELYDELAVIILRMPPLRDRRDDIPLLVRYFIHRLDDESDRRSGSRSDFEPALRRTAVGVWLMLTLKTLRWGEGVYADVRHSTIFPEYSDYVILGAACVNLRAEAPHFHGAALGFLWRWPLVS